MKFYIILYLFGAGLLLSTTLASSQLVGSDVHLEYYFAKQTLEHGYNSTLPNSVNADLSVSLFAPYISERFHIPLKDVFRIVYPLLYALAPCFLFYIYSRFMNRKWAFLSALFFIAVPTFFLEMPQTARTMFTQVIMVGLLVLIFSGMKPWKWALFGLGSLMVVVSSHSSATLWFIFLLAIGAGYLLMRQRKQAGATFAVLGISLGLFIGYALFSSSGWLVEDIGNTIQSAAATVTGGDGSMAEVVQQTAVNHIGSTQYMMRMALGLDILYVDWPSKLFRIVQLLTEFGLVVGIVAMLRSNAVPVLYKVLVAVIAFILVVALIFPVVASTINPTRFYHLMLLVVAPALIFACAYFFEKRALAVGASLLAVYFIFTSGLVFQLVGYNNIEKPTVPYSILATNRPLDAGSYLTGNDDEAARWAVEHRITTIHGDTGAVLIAQDYFDNYHALPWDGRVKSGDYLLIRTWNTERNTFSAWAGPGLKEQVPLVLPEGNVLFRSGDAFVMEVK